jgi:hypothetical protein
VRDKRERWEEAVKAIVPMFTRESWEFHGQYYDFRRATSFPSHTRSRTRRCGSPARTSRPSAKRRMGHGRAGLHLRDTGGGARLGAQVLQQPAQQLAEARRLSDESQRCDGIGLHVRATDAEAEAKAAGWTFFIFALSYYGRKGVDAPGTSDLWKEYQSWKGGPEERRRWNRA